jgi:hypothetical protein
MVVLSFFALSMILVIFHHFACDPAPCINRPLLRANSKPFSKNKGYGAGMKVLGGFVLVTAAPNGWWVPETTVNLLGRSRAKIEVYRCFRDSGAASVSPFQCTNPIAQMVTRLPNIASARSFKVTPPHTLSSSIRKYEYSTTF